MLVSVLACLLDYIACHKTSSCSICSFPTFAKEGNSNLIIWGGDFWYNSSWKAIIILCALNNCWQERKNKADKAAANSNELCFLCNKMQPVNHTKTRRQGKSVVQCPYFHFILVSPTVERELCSG